MPSKIVVSVDFGTTYSAIGYALCEDGVNPADIHFHIVQTGWPGQGRRRSPKIPSVYKFDGDEFQWGFEVQDDPDRVCFPKLFLDPEQLRTAQQLARVASAAETHSPEELARGVVKYLGSLRQHAIEHMIQTWDRGAESIATRPFDIGWILTARLERVEQTPREYVLSVPAIWSDAAKAKTLDCAIRAGLGSRDNPASIRLVSEPEAAAVYTISTLPDRALGKGDVFIICDAGGGTVDLATYKITSPEPRLQVDEVAVGIGGLCGSAMLNMKFRAFVATKLGQEISNDDMNEILLEFNDNIKPSFDNEDEDYTVQVPLEVPDNLDEGLQGGSLVVTSEDLRSIFDPVVLGVLILIQTQVDSVRNNNYIPEDRKIPIHLVGGFGSSNFLRRQIEEKFVNCTVLQPPDAWSAVVRGALLRTLVKTRKIRASYGVEFLEPWTDAHERGPLAEFAQNHKIWDHFESRHLCKNRMKWYVKKGDEFDTVREVSFPFYRCVGIHHPMKFKIDLWGYVDGEEGAEGPPFKDLDCRKIGLLNPDLSRVPRTDFPRISSPAGDYYKVSYEIVMRFDTVLEFQAKFQGRYLDPVRVEYIESHLTGLDRIREGQN
ncbi:MAG: hypothetical protein M1839_001005 [Geoglossum umbratile]|nr:MAG: hypothetical protein M1839_001005 [Geoglossum umbratile]